MFYAGIDIALSISTRKLTTLLTKAGKGRLTVQTTQLKTVAKESFGVTFSGQATHRADHLP